MKLELPADVVQNIVDPFMSLLDDALIEAEYYHNSGVVNIDKWLNKLEEVSTEVSIPMKSEIQGNALNQS